MGKKIGNFNLVNYKNHPTNDYYKVLNYNSKQEAELFEEKLTEGHHFFEKDIEMHKDKPLYLFAVKNNEFEAIQKLNFEVNAVFRKPIIKNKYARYGLVIFFILIVTFALTGYFLSNFNLI